MSQNIVEWYLKETCQYYLSYIEMVNHNQYYFKKQQQSENSFNCLLTQKTVFTHIHIYTRIHGHLW